MDVCGTVDAAGAGAEHLLGRRVVAIAKDALGGIAEHAVAPAVSTFDAPPELDDAEAAAFLIPFHTTHLALFRRGRLVEGETLLVHSGASGLGTAAIQLGVAAGARVIATVSSEAKAELCRSLGADLVDRPHRAGRRRGGARRDRRGRRPRRVRPGGRRLRGGVVAVHRPRGSVPRRGVRRRRRQRDDRPSAAHGEHRQPLDRGRARRLGRRPGSGHAPLRVQPVHPRGRRRGPRRSAPARSPPAASAPTSAGS